MSMTSRPTFSQAREKARGVLLGQFIGDSLGSLVEFRSAEDIAAEYPGGVRDMECGGTFRLLPGQPTDDSQMAMMLLRSLLEADVSGGGLPFDQDDVRARYQWWLGTDPFDAGITISHALRSAPEGQSQSNGALMRISPLAIAAAGIADGDVGLSQALAAAEADARITHLNEVVIDANRAFVAALVTGIRGGGLGEMLTAAEGAARTQEVRQALTGEYEAYLQHSGWVLLSLSLAFNALRHAEDDGVEEALVRVIAVGGDTDTHAAITGSLLGARHGAHAWPHRWVSTVLQCTPDDEWLEPHKRLRGEFFPTHLLTQADQLLTRTWDT